MFRILVAGQDASERDFIRRIVMHRQTHVDVIECGCGRQVLEALEKQDFDLALVEQDLPCLCGTEILRRVRPRPSAPPIVLIAEWPSRELAQRARRLGAYDLLEKPIMVPRITAVVCGTEQAKWRGHGRARRLSHMRLASRRE